MAEGTVMEKFAVGDLVIDCEEGTPGVIKVNWTGSSSIQNAQVALSPYFSVLLLRAVERRLMLEMHFENLRYFNSSTITAVIRLIADAAHKKVPVVLCYSVSATWQKQSFDALGVFQKPGGLLEIRPVAAPLSV